MAKVDSDVEILEFAIFREIEAYYLYTKLAEHVKNDKIRQSLEELAQEELEHKEKLELEIIKLGRTVNTELPPPNPDQHYIISNDHFLLDMDDKDVLLLGMEKEDAAFRIYINLSRNVVDEDSREILLALAEEEITHKLRFKKEYEEHINETEK